MESSPSTQVAALLEDTALLTQKENVDYKNLPGTPSPEEFFLLSRIRGTVSVAQICTASGLGREKTLASLDRLLEFGLVEIIGGGGRTTRQTPGRAQIKTPDATASSTRPVGDIPLVQRERDVTPTQQVAVSSTPPPDLRGTVEPDEATSVVSIEDLMNSTRVASAAQADSFLEQISAGSFSPPPAEEESEEDLFGAPDRDDDLIAMSSHDEPIAMSSHDEPIAMSSHDEPIALGSPHVDEPAALDSPASNEAAFPFESNSLADAADAGASFAPIASASGDDDDLFMPESIAHLSKVAGDAPLHGVGAIGHGPPEPAPEPEPAPAPPKAEPLREAPTPEPAPEPAFAMVEDSTPVQPEPMAQPAESDGPTPMDLDFSKFPLRFSDYEPPVDLMEQAVELDDELKRVIIYVNACLDDMTYYDLLGVAPDGARKEIRSSYFKWSKLFHPDRYYSKIVGDFGPMAETIFKHVTKANDILANKKKRAAYDEELKHAVMERAQGNVGKAGEPAADAPDDDLQKKRQMAFQILVGRADKFEENGQYLEAAESLKKAFAIGKSMDIALRVAELLLRSGKKLDEAAMFARAVTKSQSNDASAFVLLGKIYEKNAAFAEALDAFERALGASSDDAAIRTHIERVRAQLG